MDNKKYKSLIIPKLHWEKKTLTDSLGTLVAQPLEPGFGITIGNALRRILLGAIEGPSVTSFTINGINNEFSVINGVVQDAMQIMLNIKGIVIRNTSGNPGTMRLSVKGEKEVTVQDIVADSHLELVNKDHVIANVSASGELNIEFFVENGRGYQIAQWPLDKQFQEDGRIYVDAMFSPVRKVTFEVEKTRVGKDIDYDKLTIHVNTNSAVNPVEVMHYAVSVLRTQLEHFLTSAEIPFNELSAPVEEKKEKKVAQYDQFGLKGMPVEILLKPIDELELSVRALNCLLNAGITRVIDLVNLPEDEALRIKNFGRKSLTEVKDSMKAYSLSFGMNLNEDLIRKALEHEGEATAKAA